MASLKPGNEKKPSPGKLVPPNYRPENCFEHLVSDGESWQSLADRYQVSAKTIIETNFKTTIPEEVNWYLREYVNCKVPTPDGYNWRFSTSAQQGGIPGRAGIVFIPPNWLQIENAAKELTRRYVKQYFESCSIMGGIVNGPSLQIAPGMVRPNFRLQSPFALEFELKGAPKQIAQAWAAHLQLGLEMFTTSLSANQPAAFPAFASWPGGSAPPMAAVPWALLMSSDAAIAGPTWFQPMLMFPALQIPALNALVGRYANWFHNSFRVMRMGTMALRVFGQGMADPYQRRVMGTAFATPFFLSVPPMTP